MNVFIAAHKMAHLVKKIMNPILVVDSIHRVEWGDISLPGKESTQISRECLAISPQFGIRRVSRNVVKKVLRQLLLGSKRKANIMRESIVWIHKAFRATGILFDVSAKLSEILRFHVQNPNL